MYNSKQIAEPMTCKVSLRLNVSADVSRLITRLEQQDDPGWVTQIIVGTSEDLIFVQDYVSKWESYREAVNQAQTEHNRWLYVGALVFEKDFLAHFRWQQETSA